MKKSILLMVICLLFACKNGTQHAADLPSQSNTTQPNYNAIDVIPISHGSLILAYKDISIYIDPVGGSDAYNGQKSPSLILITDIHGDHLNVDTLEDIIVENSKIVAPAAVYEKLSEALQLKTSVLENHEFIDLDIGKSKLKIEAIPMYNLRPEALQFHTKGRGNGYVLTLGGHRVYISGDTEDITEMRQLEDIDIAFVCMNLPWTMPVESAASAVLEFQPKVVYPYHYRGTDGLSDIDKFKEVVTSKDETIAVRLLNWYPNVQ